MAQLHETMYGKRLFEYELPQLNRNLSRIADALEKMNTENKNRIDFPSTTSPILNNAIDFLSSIRLDEIFSKRVSNSLSDNRSNKVITNLYQLVKNSERDLLRIRNFGQKCQFEVREYLSKRNLELGMDDYDIQQRVVPSYFK